MEKEAAGIRFQTDEDEPRMENLMHNVNVQTLMEEHRKQSRKKATGIDGITKDEYEANLMENLEMLIERMKKFQYRPLPVRRTYIPKANGKLRPLGIPAYEDKLVQGVMAKLLDEVYEVRFMDCSYGFQKGKSCHDVVRYIYKTGMTGKVNYVLEADIKGFFDNVDHEWLMRFLEMDIADRRFLRYVRRFLLAGVMEEDKYSESDRGTPQGGLISPVLANVYLHYVLDTWFELEIKPRLCGEAYYVRYADDFLIMFQYESDAKAVMNVIPKRLARFSLEVAPEKTRILPFGRFKGTKDEFDFLGFTFFNATTRSGKYQVGVRTSKKKLKAKKASGQSVVAKTADKACGGNHGDASVGHAWTLQLLWSEREQQENMRVLLLSAVDDVSNAESP
jgi:group II intron reverse transcriptase/maturase